MNLLFITFGKNINIHSQAAFAIYSFLVYKHQVNSVNVITDAPQYYQHLKEEVNIITISEDLLSEWKGPHNFFWRIKIKAIEQLCNQYKGQPVIYLDTDVFLFKDSKILKESFLNSVAFMHEDEGVLSKAKSKTEKKMWHQVASKTFGSITVKESDSMWNAGVVAVPNSKNGKDISTALAICDEMCAAGVTPRLIEQFALSLALDQYYTLKPASPFIAHYWSNKAEWDKEITDFFSGCLFQQLTQQQILDLVASYDFLKHPVKQLTRNTSKRLQKYINSFFPPRNVEYASKEKD
ncbi:MAG: hypothetical protein M3413_10865 [Bacteroidota bacterium]|nr:hypothetical protein [Bacteroidota bacterium]